MEAFVNGNQELQAVRISRAAVDPDYVDMLDGLPTAVVRKAMQAAKDLRDREVSKVTGGLNLPGIGF